MTGLRIRLRENGVEVRDARIRDEPLRAVEHVLAVVDARRRAHRRGIGAGAGFRQRVRAEPLPGGKPRQPLLLLLLVPRQLQAERAELLDGEDETARRADLRDLLDRDQREQRPSSEPAVLLVEEETEEVIVAEKLDDVPGELVLLVDLGCPRRDPLARKRAHQVPKLALLVAQRVVRHARSLLAVVAHDLEVFFNRSSASNWRRRSSRRAGG